MSARPEAGAPRASEVDACKARCLREWDNVNDPPCHPSDDGWRPCPLCVRDTPDNAARGLEPSRPHA